jgi:hypothetical protein
MSVARPEHRSSHSSYFPSPSEIHPAVKIAALSVLLAGIIFSTAALNRYFFPFKYQAVPMDQAFSSPENFSSLPDLVESNRPDYKSSVLKPVSGDDLKDFRSRFQSFAMQRGGIFLFVGLLEISLILGCACALGRRSQ